MPVLVCNPYDCRNNAALQKTAIRISDGKVELGKGEKAHKKLKDTLVAMGVQLQSHNGAIKNVLRWAHIQKASDAYRCWGILMKIGHLTLFATVGSVGQ